MRASVRGAVTSPGWVGASEQAITTKKSARCKELPRSSNQNVSLPASFSHHFINGSIRGSLDLRSSLRPHTLPKFDRIDARQLTRTQRSIHSAIYKAIEMPGGNVVDSKSTILLGLTRLRFSHAVVAKVNSRLLVNEAN